jgi:hypothetical protein
MKADYIELADGRRVRIMWNMNALGEFTRMTGKEITDLTDGRVDIAILRQMVWYCAKEGEKLDGRELPLTEVELGSLMSMRNIVEFSEILREQTAGTAQKKSDRGRFPRMFFRSRG